MMKRLNFLVYPVLLGGCLLLAISCQKDDEAMPSSGDITNDKTTAIFNPVITYGTLTDQDGNIYKTVTIGAQTWMAENLRTTKYNDGTSIPNITSAAVWADLTTGAYCNFNNNTKMDSLATFGRLYNWYAVNTLKLAPVGWHVPTDAEWEELADYLGGSDAAGGKLKETDTAHWNSPNIGATNETGFTALPAGERNDKGEFQGIGRGTSYLSSTEYNSNSKFAWYHGLGNDSDKLWRYSIAKVGATSVRCIKD